MHLVIAMLSKHIVEQDLLSHAVEKNHIDKKNQTILKHKNNVDFFIKFNQTCHKDKWKCIESEVS